MAETAGSYRISRLTGEFTDSRIEGAYRLNMRALQARNLQIALLVWGSLILAFAVLDFQALGATPTFYILLACRATQATLLFILAFILRSRPHWVSNGYAVTTLEIVGFFLFLPIYFLRPEIALMTVGVLGLMLLVMFLFIPSRLGLTLFAALVGLLLLLACLVINGRGPETIIGAVILLLMPISTGYFAAQQLHMVQRRQFAMFTQARNANRALQKEVERRKLLEEELKRQATTDPLTGLFNRRQYEMLFRRERERCRRQGTTICVAMGDLDQFKQLNDQLGHDSGDIALRHVAELLTSQLREGDVIGRFGGEEFIILLPDTDVVEAERVIERLRGILADNPVPLPEQPWKLTATFSVSAVLDGEQNIADTLRRVDVGLYQGKHAGRNQVVVV